MIRTVTLRPRADAMTRTLTLHLCPRGEAIGLELAVSGVVGAGVVIWTVTLRPRAPRRGRRVGLGLAVSGW